MADPKKSEQVWRIGEIPDLRPLSEVKTGILLGFLKMTMTEENGDQVLDLNGRIDELCEMTGMSRHALYFCLNQLLDAEAIGRSGRRGVYFVNRLFFDSEDNGGTRDGE